jgi:acyl transferase domain-containing protein
MPTHADDLPQLKRALHALQGMRARLDALEQARTEPIAVVGMACRFPGGADSPAAFWRLLIEGRDGVTEIPADRWDAAALYDPDIEASGRMATRWGGFVAGVDRWDPAFFGISPREASQMDPQQRLLLETAYEALEHAGETLERLRGSAAGVFVGVHSHSSDYGWFQLRELEEVGTYTSTGTAHSIVANRLSYWLDLRGPSLAVDTACSSSLVAAHLAVQSLRARECDLAVAGGVNLLLSPEVTVALSKMRMMAADGRCKTFDARADGFVRGEGCGVVVLKRLSDALAGNDPILALVAGSAVNQDGATNGLTAPSGLAQREVVRRALADGKLDPARVGYVETHGTGTQLGDPIEVEALADVLGRAGDAPCLLGAVKTNLGHLEGAAGIAGLIKAVLALQHGVVPPNLHFREPNPHLPLAGTRFRIPTEPVAWPAGTGRHVGVSSFGFGGTNAHLVLREAPAVQERGGSRSEDSREPSAYLLPVSAHTPQALRERVEALAERLGEAPPLADLLYTAAVRRTHHPHRVGLVGGSAEGLSAAAAAWLAGEPADDAVQGHADPDARQWLVWVFSGQGSQWPAMGRELLEREPVFRSALEACDALLRPLAGWSLLDELAAPPERSRLDRTEVTQPVLFAVQVALAALWKSWGIAPDAVVGHSVGEVAAAHVAGALDLEQAVRVIFHRGQVMQPASGRGRMAAVGLPRAAAEAVLARHPGATVAAVNAPGSVVISGSPGAVEAAVAEFVDAGAFARMLPVSLAAHSEQMEPLRAPLERALAGLTPEPRTVPLFSTVTGRAARPGDFGAAYWGRNLREPVQFHAAVGAALESGATAFLEVSPHPILRTPLEHCTGGGTPVLGSLTRAVPARTALLRTLAALYAYGHGVDWSALHPDGGRVLELPRYPWQRQRYWVEPATPRPRVRVERVLGLPASDASPFEGRLLRSPGLRGPVWECEISAEAVDFLGTHRVGGEAVMPAAGFAELLLHAGRATLGRQVQEIQGLAILHPLRLDGDDGRTVQCVMLPAPDGRAACEVHGRAGDDPDGWVLHATAVLGTQGVAESNGHADGDLLPRAALPAPSPESAIGAVVSLPPGVERLWRENGWAIAALRVDEALPAAQRRAALLDTCFRGLAAVAADEPEGRYIVASVERVRPPAAPLPAGPFHVVLRPRDTGARGFTGDIEILNEAMAPLGELAGVRYARLGGSGADEVRPDEWLHEVVWRPRGILHHGGREGWPGTAALPESGLARPADQGMPAEPSPLAAALDRLSCAFVARALSEMGVRLEPGRSIAPEEIGRGLRTPPHHRRLLERMLGMLVEEGVLARAGRGWKVVRAPSPAELRTELEELLLRFPDHDAELELFGRCGAGLAGVLRGETDPLQLLFPEGPLQGAERLYADSPLARGPNARVREAVGQIVAGLPGRRVLRILEVGAGTGGTAGHLLPVLPPLRTEYVFSDVSQAFLDRAAERFRGYPFVRYALLDVEREPEPQGMAPGQFDLVIAANVLHAAADLRSALARVRRLLVPGGRLLLVEGCRPTRWIDLVFGLTEGWWKFSDATLRPDHPLLAPDRWPALLAGCGFAAAEAAPLVDSDSTYPQALVAARADSVRHAAPPLPVMGGWLVVVEDAADGLHLAERIHAGGGDCVIAGEDPESALRLWLASADRPAGVICLAGAASTAADADAATVQRDVFARCSRVVRLALALQDVGGPVLPRLWIATRAAQPVRAGEAADPAQAALWGLARSVALECPDHWGGLIDLPADAAPNAAAELTLAQVLARDGEDQAAFRNGDRYVPRLVRAPSAEVAVPGFRADAAYLVTGGLGTLGMELARRLAERGAGHLVLVGRTPLPERGAWDGLPADAPARGRVAAIQELERRGAAVTPVAADVADEAAMRALFARFGSGLPPLRGVFHTAAVIGFAPLPRLADEALDAVLRPKVAGAWTLHRLSEGLELDHFVLFSSVAGLWGSRGMTHYTAANAFLDALAHLRRARGLPALAVDWGGWEGGDRGRDANRFLEVSDFRLLPTGPALDMLGRAMAEGVTQRTVAWVDWADLRAAYELPGGRPLLTEIRFEARADEPSSPADGAPARGVDLLRHLESLDHAEARERLVGHVRAEVAEVLGLDPDRLLEPRQGFFKLGMDSLMTVELRSRLERSLGLRLPTTIAFEYPNIEALAGFLADRLPRAAPASAAAIPAADAAPVAAADEPSEADLARLSDDELASMLDGAIADLLLDDDPTAR